MSWFRICHLGWMSTPDLVHRTEADCWPYPCVVLFTQLSACPGPCEGRRKSALQALGWVTALASDTDKIVAWPGSCLHNPQSLRRGHTVHQYNLNTVGVVWSKQGSVPPAQKGQFTTKIQKDYRQLFVRCVVLSEHDSDQKLVLAVSAE